jgi:membrane-associated phospholipid phosphatase
VKRSFWSGRRVRAASIVAWLVFETATARAEPESQDSSAPVGDVRWRDEWPRVRFWEYAGTAAFISAAVWLRLSGPEPPDNWRGGILFDDAILNAIRIEDQPTARGVELMTEVTFYGAMAYRLVDSVAVPLIGYGNTDLALQMSMIDLSAFSVQAIVLFGGQTLVGRTRPLVTRCEREGRTDERCQVPSRLGEQRSFIAGHTATSVTAAGLTCLHHTHIPLYGEPGDALACTATLLAAVASGAGRVTTELHYPTDLAFGVALGAVSGWFLPMALHYGFRPPSLARRSSHGAEATRGIRLTVLPYADGERLGLFAGGRF